MRALLRVHRLNDDIHKWLHEVRCRVSDRRSLIGLRFFGKAATWFENEWMPLVRVWHGRMKAMDGALLSLMINPIGNESTQLVSAVVYGLGSRRGSMWSLGRMEWLALELVIEARHVLLERWGNDDCALWSMLYDQFKCSRSVSPSLFIGGIVSTRLHAAAS